MAARTIILHYHLFKNAGASVDKILKDNFPGRWVTLLRRSNYDDREMLKIAAARQGS